MMGLLDRRGTFFCKAGFGSRSVVPGVGACGSLFGELSVDDALGILLLVISVVV
jgi:hypothetical protein